eukprot:g3889.t1
MEGGDFVSGFAKGLRVIETFSDGKQKLSIAEVARLSGLDRATARRSLLTLSHLGYAHYDGKFFSLTAKILRLGHTYLSGAPMARTVQPALEALSGELGQSTSVSVLDDTDVIYIARATQKRVMSINLTAGSRLPAYCASMGRVLLAALPEAEAEAVLRRSPLKQLTPFTKMDMAELQEEIRTVREEGFAIIDQELELGLRSIAASGNGVLPQQSQQGMPRTGTGADARSGEAAAATERGSAKTNLSAERQPVGAGQPQQAAEPDRQQAPSRHVEAEDPTSSSIRKSASSDNASSSTQQRQSAQGSDPATGANPDNSSTAGKDNASPTDATAKAARTDETSDTASAGSDRPSNEVTGSIDISTEQRTEIRSVIVESKIEPIEPSFSVSVGVSVPKTVELHPLPPRVVEIVPAYRSYRYFVLADDRIVIVDPSSFEIVYILTV